MLIFLLKLSLFRLCFAIDSLLIFTLHSKRRIDSFLANRKSVLVSTKYTLVIFAHIVS